MTNETQRSVNGINGDAVGDERERQRIEMTDLDTNATTVDHWASAGKRTPPTNLYLVTLTAPTGEGAT